MVVESERVEQGLGQCALAIQIAEIAGVAVRDVIGDAAPHHVPNQFRAGKGGQRDMQAITS